MMMTTYRSSVDFRLLRCTLGTDHASRACKSPRPETSGDCPLSFDKHT